MTTEREVGIRLRIGMFILSLFCLTIFVGYFIVCVMLVFGTASLAQTLLFTVGGAFGSLVLMNISARFVGWVTTIGMKPVDKPS